MTLLFAFDRGGTSSCVSGVWTRVAQRPLSGNFLVEDLSASALEGGEGGDKNGKGEEFNHLLEV